MGQTLTSAVKDLWNASGLFFLHSLCTGDTGLDTQLQGTQKRFQVYEFKVLNRFIQELARSLLLRSSRETL